ncbi:MAG: hypothetical protein HY000_38480, partial [Planctomycetes bacterium]|nr:hypothetical protein [Planctomycetota bacterium]
MLRQGIAVSPGVTVGKAYCIHEIFVNPETRQLAEAETLAELDRYDQAVRAALRKGFLAEADIDEVLRGVFRVMIRLGQLDPRSMVPYH